MSTRREAKPVPAGGHSKREAQIPGLPWKLWQGLNQKEIHSIQDDVNRCYSKPWLQRLPDDRDGVEKRDLPQVSLRRILGQQQKCLPGPPPQCSFEYPTFMVLYNAKFPHLIKSGFVPAGICGDYNVYGCDAADLSIYFERHESSHRFNTSSGVFGQEVCTFWGLNVPTPQKGLLQPAVRRIAVSPV